MQVATEAFYMGKQNIHSNKTGKDYTKYSLVVEGGFTTFILLKDKGDKMEAKAPAVYQKFVKERQPVRCEVVLGIDFTERGNFVSLVEIH